MAALREPLLLLADHAQLERKAAINALDLFSRRPRGDAAAGWMRSMAAIARDEADHLATVVRLLEKRGGSVRASHQNQYATSLRRLIRRGQGSKELADRLLVSGLIEARSCERFVLLAEVAVDGDLRRLYRGLAGSEAGHYRVFVDLAGSLLDAGDVAARWDRLLEAESEIIRSQPPGPAMHSGPPVEVG